MSGVKVIVDLSGQGFSPEEQAEHERILVQAVSERAVVVVEEWAVDTEDHRALRFAARLELSDVAMGDERVDKP